MRSSRFAVVRARVRVPGFMVPVLHALVFLLTLVLCPILVVGNASASMIGVYFDSLGTDCETTQPLYAFGRLYLLALLYDDAAAEGITGAEFRLDGFPWDWWPTVTPNPAASTTLGNPLTGGCEIAFSECQTGIVAGPGSPAVVLLYTVDYFSTTLVTNHVLAVRVRSSPLPWWEPSLTRCDAPMYSRIMVPGGQAAFNYPGFCTTAVENRSWGSIKQLYE